MIIGAAPRSAPLLMLAIVLHLSLDVQRTSGPSVAVYFVRCWILCCCIYLSTWSYFYWLFWVTWYVWCHSLGAHCKVNIYIVSYSYDQIVVSLVVSWHWQDLGGPGLQPNFFYYSLMQWRWRRIESRCQTIQLHTQSRCIHVRLIWQWLNIWGLHKFTSQIVNVDVTVVCDVPRNVQCFNMHGRRRWDNRKARKAWRTVWHRVL